MGFLLLFLISSCGNTSSTSAVSSNPNQTSVTISLSQIAAGALLPSGQVPASVKSISVTALDSAGNLIAGPATANAPGLTVTLSVPNASGIRFRVLAFSALNAGGTKLYEGLSAAQSLTGTAVTVPVKMNLSVIVGATLVSSDPYTGVVTFDLNGLVSGATPPATSPLLWSLPVGQGTLGTPTANGATIRWTSPQKAGVYTITAKVDTAVNPDQSPVISDVAVITVTDGLKPVITMQGINPYSISQGNIYVDAGAAASDNFDGDITAKIVTTSTVNSAVPGTYTVTYNVTDLAGNKAIPVVRTVIVIDTTAPVIQLNGVSPVTVEAGSVYVDGKATVTDNVDATNTALIGVNTVNTAIPGTYTVTYNASDAAGNPAITVVRTVNVVDTTAPVITPPANITVAAVDGYGAAVNDPYIAAFLAGATATDNVAVVGVITNNAPARFPLGLTIVTFSASDAIPNNGTATATVNVLDQSAPVITLNGINPYAMSAGQVYVDAKATFTDNVDPTNTQLAGVSTVNTAVPGSYTVTYNATDVAGNPAAQVVRTVVVGDTTPPVITLNGVSPATVEAGSIYVDAYATVTDNIDPTNTALTGVSTVNAAVPGTYTVTYNTSDTSGNPAVAVVRTVNVVDTTAPVITPPANITVAAVDSYGAAVNDPYVAVFLAGATAIDNVAVVGAITNNAPAQFPLGLTTVTFSASDAAPNTGTATATVNVTDRIPPVIQINGINPYTMSVGQTYIDAYATVTDNVDVINTQLIGVSTVDTAVPGTYTVTYNAADAAGNPAIAAVRTVNVVGLDVALTHTVSNPAPLAGQQVIFTLLAMNNGPFPATGAVVTDTIPAGLSIDSYVSSAGAFDPVKGVWVLGNMANGGFARLDIYATPKVTTPLIASASFAANEVDINPTNSSGISATLQASAATDLALTMSVNSLTPAVGTSVYYTVTLTNNGPLEADQIIVNDLLPAGLTLTQSIVSINSSYIAGTGDWSVNQFASGSSATLDLYTTVNAAAGTVIANSASVTQAADPNTFQMLPDPYSANNSDSTSITVGAALPGTTMIHVQDVNGVAVSGANVFFYNKSTRAQGAFGTTDASGNALGLLNPATSYFIGVGHPSLPLLSGFWDGNAATAGVAGVINLTQSTAVQLNAFTPPTAYSGAADLTLVTSISGLINGTITDANAVPLANVRVEAVANSPYANLGNGIFTFTNANGQYAIGMPAGSYLVVAGISALDTYGFEKAVPGGWVGGYLSGNNLPVVQSDLTAVAMTVSNGAVTSMNGSLLAGGTISANVIDNYSAPIPFAFIQIEPYAGGNFQWGGIDADIYGQYSKNVLAGPYLIRSDGQYYDMNVWSNLPLQNGQVGGYADGAGTLVADRNLAVIQTVTAGGNINVSMKHAAGGTITGQVVDPYNVAISYINVIAQDVYGQPFFSATADVYGQYAINVLPSQYKVLVDSYTYDPNTNQQSLLPNGLAGGYVDIYGQTTPDPYAAAIVPILIGDLYTANAQVSVAPAFNAFGVAAAGAPVANAIVVAIDAFGMTASAVTDAYGNYQINAYMRPPVLLRVDRVGLPSLYSIATSSGSITHVNTLTTLATARALGVSNTTAINGNFAVTGRNVVYTDMYTAVTNMMTSLGLTSFTVLGQRNPLDDPLFSANGLGLDAVMDGLYLTERDEDGDLVFDLVLTSRSQGLNNTVLSLKSTLLGALANGTAPLVLNGLALTGDNIGGVPIAENEVYILQPGGVPNKLPLAQFPQAGLGFGISQVNRIIPVLISGAQAQGANLLDPYNQTLLTQMIDQVLINLNPSNTPGLSMDDVFEQNEQIQIGNVLTGQVDVNGAFVPAFDPILMANQFTSFFTNATGLLTVDIYGNNGVPVSAWIDFSPVYDPITGQNLGVWQNSFAANGKLTVQLQPGVYNLYIYGGGMDPYTMSSGIDPYTGLTSYLNQTVSGPGGQPVSINSSYLGVTPAQVTTTLVPENLQGQVVDALGRGVPNMNVGIIDSNGSWLNSAQTNAQGWFQFNVASGNYRLLANRMNSTFEGNMWWVDNYTTTLDPAQAGFVQVAIGTTVITFNATLRHSQPWSPALIAGDPYLTGVGTFGLDVYGNLRGDPYAAWAYGSDVYAFVDAYGNYTEQRSGAVLSTMDGGQSWDRTWAKGMSRIDGMDMVDIYTGWLIGRETTSGMPVIGNTITGAPLSYIDVYGELTTPAGVHVAGNAVDGYAVFAFGQGTNPNSLTQDTFALRSVDGFNWTKQWFGQFFAAVSDADFIDANIGFTVLNYGEVWATQDSGLTWQPKTRLPGSYWDYKLDMVDAYTGWAVSQMGLNLVFKTVDGGQNWIQYDLSQFNLYINPQDVRAADAATIFISCTDGVMVVTHDGGLNWQQSITGIESNTATNLGMTAPLRAIAANGLGQVYVAGGASYERAIPQQSVLLQSSNNGRYNTGFVTVDVYSAMPVSSMVSFTPVIDPITGQNLGVMQNMITNNGQVVANLAPGQYTANVVPAAALIDPYTGLNLYVASSVLDVNGNRQTIIVSDVYGTSPSPVQATLNAASLLGHVVDSLGRGLPNFTVDVYDSYGNLKDQVISNALGWFQSGVPAGLYSLKAFRTNNTFETFWWQDNNTSTLNQATAGQVQVINGSAISVTFNAVKRNTKPWDPSLIAGDPYLVGVGTFGVDAYGNLRGDPYTAWAYGSDVYASVDAYGNYNEQRVGVILSTVDGGLVWDRFWANGMSRVDGMDMVDVYAGWMIGAEQTSGMSVIGNTISGAPLSYVDVNNELTTTSGVHVAGSIIDGYAVFAFGQGAGPNLTWDTFALRSTDGFTWTKQWFGQFTGQLVTDADFVDTYSGMVLAGNEVWGTNDSGITWQLRSSLPVSWGDATRISMIDAYSGWAIDRNVVGKAWQTLDGGYNWTQHNFNIFNFNVYPTNITVSDPSTIIVSGGAGEIVVSFDGGITWRLSSSGVESRNDQFGSWINGPALQGLASNNLGIVYAAGSSWQEGAVPQTSVLLTSQSNGLHNTGLLAGNVYIGVGGAPANIAMVTFSPVYDPITGQTLGQYVQTFALNGTYTVNLAPGSYVVQAQQFDAYGNLSVGTWFAAGSGRSGDVSGATTIVASDLLGSTSPNPIDFYGYVPAMIQGTILDNLNQPAAGVEVAVLPVADVLTGNVNTTYFNWGSGLFSDVAGFAMTDIYGNYSMNVLPGVWRIFAGYGLSSNTTGATPTVIWAGTGVAPSMTIAGAASINALEGIAYRADMTLPALVPVDVTVLAAGQSVPGSIVELNSPVGIQQQGNGYWPNGWLDTTTWQWVASSYSSLVTDNNGRVRFSTFAGATGTVVAGFDVYASSSANFSSDWFMQDPVTGTVYAPTWLGDTADAYSAALVTATAAGANITINLQPTYNIYGTVTGNLTKLGNFGVMAAPVIDANGNYQGAFSDPLINPVTGQYKVSVVPGTYKVATWDNNGWWGGSLPSFADGAGGGTLDPALATMVTVTNADVRLDFADATTAIININVQAPAWWTLDTLQLYDVNGRGPTTEYWQFPSYGVPQAINTTAWFEAGPGSYYLAARFSGLDASGRYRSYVMYWDGVAWHDAATAVPIAVPAGGLMISMDLSSLTIPTQEVRVRVLGTDGHCAVRGADLEFRTVNGVRLFAGGSAVDEVQDCMANIPAFPGTYDLTMPGEADYFYSGVNATAVREARQWPYPVAAPAGSVQVVVPVTGNVWLKDMIIP